MAARHFDALYDARRAASHDICGANLCQTGDGFHKTGRRNFEGMDFPAVITVFGSINLDLIGTVERLPRPGETVPGNAIFDRARAARAPIRRWRPRAPAPPFAWSARSARTTSPSSRWRLLRQGGVDLSRVRAAEGPTGVALILVDAAGENVIAVIPGGNGAVSEADAEALDFRAGRCSAPAARGAGRRDRGRGATGACRRRARAPELRAVPRGRARTCSRRDASRRERERMRAARRCARLSRRFDRSSGARAVGAKRATVIVTLGRTACSRSKTGAVLTALGACGRGDRHGRRRRHVLRLSRSRTRRRAAARECAWISAAAGSLACTKSGAQPSIPLRAEVEAAMQAARGDATFAASNL